MAQRRARLSDNDPLSPTDRVLVGFEQHSKPTSQPVDQSESQEDNNDMSQQVSKSASEDDRSTSRKADKSTSRKVDKSASQVAEKPRETVAPETQPDNNSASQQVEKSAIRKATFQISDAVLQQLDTFHLQLQLELGKANAPYKEVIVEEAIARILAEAADDRSGLIAVLRERQQQRD